MELIEKQSAAANLHLLFGRTEHFNRQQVITIMQPAIRSELNDWIELLRCPSIKTWILEAQLTQEQRGEVDEHLLRQHRNSLVQTPPPAIKPDTEIAC
jgi:hypothetical protein